MAFYVKAREEWLVDRPWIGGAVERLYEAWLRGADLDALRKVIAAEGRANDPRVRLHAAMR